ncbi:MAG: hypothetical protein C4291_05570 [Candidatus Dadabacteria bacterium]
MCVRRSAIFDVFVDFDRELRETIRSFLHALEYVDALYHIQCAGETSFVLENSLFGRIIETLKKGALYISDEERLDLERKIDHLARGIYDLCSITLRRKGEDYIDLTIGKIFSPDKNYRRYYSGVIGVINKSFDSLIRAYDEKMDFSLGSLPIPEEYKGSFIRGNVPVMRCIDVLSFAGELNIRHKPICVFFSGGGSENLSTLSMVTVFINVYVRRFELISREIARRYIENYSIIEDLDYKTTAGLLLLWLRGHDIGHFYGVDSLEKMMSELDRTYLILHELKSDMVALYNLRCLADDLLRGDMLAKAYMVSISEMFRYIRRDRFYNYADTASAFLAYMYFKESGSVEFDVRTKKFRINLSKLEEDIENLNTNLLRIFAEGDMRGATELVNRWGDIKELGQHSFPHELRVLEDADIPHYIDLNFTIKDRVLDLD